jgi:hypothetical protein
MRHGIHDQIAANVIIDLEYASFHDLVICFSGQRLLQAPHRLLIDSALMARPLRPT